MSEQSSSSAARPRVAILGGGVAGLAAALRLGESGRFEPVVFEADHEVGGLARSLNFKGISTDLGPHRIHTELPEVEALVADVAAPSLYTVRRKSRILLRGRFLAYPPSPFEVLLRLGPVRCASFAAGLLGAKLRPPAAGEETFDSLMRSAFGGPLYEYMIRPYSEKVWKTPPEEIHADTARVRVSAGSLAKMVAGFVRREKKGAETSLREFKYVRGGVQTLVRHLRERAEAVGAIVRVASPVSEIMTEETGGARLRATAVRCGGESVRADHVISTVALPDLLGKLLPDAAPLREAREQAAGLVYLGIVFVIIIVRRKIISGDNWLYFPEPGFIFNRAYEAKSFDPEMGPEDRSVLCIEVTCRPGDATDRMTDDAIREEVTRQITSTGLFDAGEVDEAHVHRLRWGYPLYSPDYHDRLAKVFNGLRAVENLLSTGRQGMFNHNNTDHSILMGLRAADCVIDAGEAPTAERWYDGADEFKKFRIVD